MSGWGRLVLALLGSGEFEPWSAEVDRWLLERGRPGDGRVLIVPTASAPEGDAVFDAWGAKGLAHFEAQGVRAEVLPLKTRADAEREDVAARLAGASLVYVSGGNPAYLARTLTGTRFWRELVEELRRGVAYAGCSAGVACLTEDTFDTVVAELGPDLWKPGLGLVRDVLFGPHWDVVDLWIPGAREFILNSVPAGRAFVGLDEETAMVGDGREWSVLGRGAVHVLADGAWRSFRAGETFPLPLTLAG
ncbi:MAG TPA: Type 1 glutamine amidotransferase-like domain-containing protein [Actinomycetota bacterium]|nr:Type 1 glutamine amidotransferase-like domain-containing protein [Actinomycetota bacterium]